MKKTYIAPTLSVIKLNHKYALLTLSADGLDGFGGSGGDSPGGKSADARRGFWDED